MEPAETRELRCFIAVAEELHFGRAAGKLGIAQPPLSRAIRQLERRIGVTLIERTSRSVRLTNAGEVLLREGRAALEAVAAAVRRAQRAGRADPSLVLVMKPGGDGGLLPSILAEYQTRAGALPVEIDFSISERAAMLRDGRADVGLLHSPQNDLTGLDAEELITERQVVVVSEHHRLARLPSVRRARPPGHPRPGRRRGHRRHSRRAGHDLATGRSGSRQPDADRVHRPDAAPPGRPLTRLGPAMLTGTDTRRLLAEERGDFAAFLATLSAEQWRAPTLCEAWRVRDVVAHVISYDDLGAAALLALTARGRFQLGRINAAALARYATFDPERLLELLARNPRPRGLPARLGGRVGLTETLIHHQDIRRGLRQPRAIPAERLLPALRTAMAAPDIAGPWRVRGIRLTATDIGLTAGAGHEVQGAAEALLMAIAGRRAALSELSGPGRAKLARRIGG